MKVEVGGPAIFNHFKSEKDWFFALMDGRVLVLEIDENYFGQGQAGVKVKGDQPSNVGSTWWAYSWEVQPLG